MAEPVGEHDLAGVKMTGQDQVPTSGLDPIERTREVAEQDPQIGGCGREATLARVDPRARIDTGQLDRPAVQLDLDRVVGEERAVREASQLDRPGERVARDRQIMVPEHDIRVPEPLEQGEQQRLAAAVARADRP